MLPGGPLGLMALCVFGFGFPNFFLLLGGFFRGFYESFFLYFFSSIERFFGFLVRNFCLELFLFFPLKGKGFSERVWIEESQSSVRGRSPLKGG